jgi:predicted nucleic acid-binding protein
MTTYYLDTSALIKRYVGETGSPWLRVLLDAPTRPAVLLVHLVIVEVTSALMRRVREGTLTHAEYTQAQNAFRADCLRQYELVAAIDEVIDEANRLLETYLLRAYDALHLAAAVVSNRQLLANNLASLVFISADDRLNQAASAEGLAVDNPNSHP